MLTSADMTSPFDNFECDDCGYLGHSGCAGEGWDDYGDPDNIFGY